MRTSTSHGAAWDPEKIEAWLQASLVPVEPTSGFVHRLRARLVEYQGQGAFSPWMLVALLGVALLFLLAALNAAARLLVTVFGVLTALQRQRSSRRD